MIEIMEKAKKHSEDIANSFLNLQEQKKKEEEEKKGELTAKIIERTKRKTKSFDNAAKASSENE